MNVILTLTSKNQLTLPVSMVSLLGLNKGSKIWTQVKENKIVLEKIDDSWDSLQGSLTDTPLTKGKSTLEVIELAKKLEAKRLTKKYGL